MASCGTKFVLEEGVPSAKEFHKAQYLRSDSDPFWSVVEAYDHAAPSSSESMLFCPNAEVDQVDRVNPFSVLRFCMERGDIPYVETHFGAHCSVPQIGQSGWMTSSTMMVIGGYWRRYTLLRQY